ncbi:alpha/beta hydrolase [Streptomyces sp. NPDC002643]
MRRLWGCLVLCGVTVATLIAVDARGSEAAGRHEAAYSYGAHPRQSVDVYWNTPGEERDEEQPGIVILHGGYWYEDTGWTTWARRFADAGYAVFDVDYRPNTDAAWPAQRDDALSALEWIEDHADAFDLDANKLILFGSSTGGQIATTVATYGSGAYRVDGVVALSPVVSPYRVWQDGNATTATEQQRKLRDNATLLARCHPDPKDNEARDGGGSPGCWDTWLDMSARSRASGADDAPMYLIHSEDDPAPATYSRELEASEEIDHNMPANGVTVETVPGSSHGGALLKEKGVADRVLSWIGERTP